MIKKLIAFAIVAVLFFIPSTLADYNYFDDFTTLDTNVWGGNDYGHYDIYNNQELRCTPSGTPYGGLEFLPFQEFNDYDFEISFNMSWQDSYASHLLYFTDDISKIYTPPTEYIGFINYRNSGSTPQNRLY